MNDSVRLSHKLTVLHCHPSSHSYGDIAEDGTEGINIWGNEFGMEFELLSTV